MIKQFSLQDIPEPLLMLDEMIGDLALSLWEDNNLIYGIINTSDLDALTARIKILFPEAHLEFNEVQQNKEPLAFGDGTHPTTKGCLHLLRKITLANKIERALDIGTGTGILALELEKLHVPTIVATDYEADAIFIAKQALSSTLLIESIHLNHPQILNMDLIVANLFLNSLITLAPSIKKALSLSGHLILSGILEEQLPSLLKAYTELGFKELEKIIENQWVVLYLIRKDLQ